MAKKKVIAKLKKGAKDLWARHKDEVLNLMGEFAETELKQLAAKLKDVPRIKRAIRRKIWAMKLCLIGGLLLALGVAALLNSLWQPFAGFWLIVLGLVLVIVAKILKH